ncbi:phage protease [Vibrio ruber]|uniref:phage protease n=1 Tax=Vibrio ruber TaxID=184755 RepID=UPI0028929F83|nr:phage protease [Vibrio ruber]WNJ96546.1 phage protease [Vibrio ruber]
MNQLYLSLCFELPHGDVPEWIQLLPAGQMTGNDGRSFVNSNPQQVIIYWQAIGRDIPLDIEHATEIKAPKGEPAPAQGWFDKLEVRDGEVWAHLTPNPSGIATIANREYRYISPAFYHDSEGNILGLSSVGLTNKPNLKLPALNHQQEKQPMPIPAAIAVALSLNSETATEHEAVNAINKLKDDTQLALNRAENPDLEKFIPKETYELALNRATEAEAKVKERQEADITALVDTAITEGKIAPANKEMYLAACRAEGGIEKFQAFAKSAPKLVSDTHQHDKTPDSDQTKLTEGELAICRQLGLTEAQFLAAK